MPAVIPPPHYIILYYINLYSTSFKVKLKTQFLYKSLLLIIPLTLKKNAFLF